MRAEASLTAPPPEPSAATTILPAWGPAPLPDGAWRFRLWAPSQPSVDLVLNGEIHPMRQSADGWYEFVTVHARPGDTYLFQLADGTRMADPASRLQAFGATGPSVVVAPRTYRWTQENWRGRPWSETILYELHVGTFTPEGTFRAAIDRLPHLASTGITAIEVMPIAHFPGERGWGYDGVLHYAPHTAYGSPDDVRAFVDAAHALGISVLLDVVYNHFGPEGNYLSASTPEFFRSDRPTPWGAAIAFRHRAVRRYFIENALYWLGEFRFDGLRFDATEEIADDGPRHMLFEMTEEIRAAFPDRQIHLIAEDQHSRHGILLRDEAGRARHFTAAWNDDLHHALHVIATGESLGHYARYADAPGDHLDRATAEGFLFSKGEIGEGGQDASHPPDVHVNFLQNHDQIGNRGFGERLTALTDPARLEVLTAMLLLIPQVPMLFMGEEYGETGPFHFFADYDGELGEAVRNGRRKEAENFGGLPAGKNFADLPDPVSPETLERSRLDWTRAETADGRRHRDEIRALIALRQEHVAPLIAKAGPVGTEILPTGEEETAVDWSFADARLQMRMTLADEGALLPATSGTVIYRWPPQEGGDVNRFSGPGILVALEHKHGETKA
ncbi:malto-oligosyltrehalose trehalohydrolase [Ensifer soli]|uniref:malto-oligosyltrehalose trehalohydrolase n=1 Tax=Ciceribacter sp. sgz301302 TaxID=3342379 RepID=UPI0035BA336A